MCRPSRRSRSPPRRSSAGWPRICRKLNSFRPIRMPPRPQDVAAGRADAAVSTALAAQRYGLDALAAGIVDEPNARTRFVLVGLPGPPPKCTGADRTSVVLRLDNVPGALVAAMTELSIRDIDLTRIESRPTRTELGTYIFFLDFVGHIDDDSVAEALRALHRRCADVRYLGSWPTGEAVGATPPQSDEAAAWLDRTPGGQVVSGRLVLVRHGQSHGNVDRRLDTRPPGAELTDLGRDQARAFARALSRPPAMIAHSIATRAVQTAAEIAQRVSRSAAHARVRGHSRGPGRRPGEPHRRGRARRVQRHLSALARR